MNRIRFALAVIRDAIFGIVFIVGAVVVIIRIAELLNGVLGI